MYYDNMLYEKIGTFSAFMLFCIVSFGQVSDADLIKSIENAVFLSYDKKDITLNEKKILKRAFNKKIKIWNPEYVLTLKQNKRLLVILKEQNQTIIAYQCMNGLVSFNELVVLNLEKKIIERRVHFWRDVFTQNDLADVINQRHYHEK